MKNIAILAAAIIGSALLHMFPVISIAIIVAAGETFRAVGVCMLAVGCLGIGYLHGKHRTNFKVW